jgi:hypothetical protein
MQGSGGRRRDGRVLPLDAYNVTPIPWPLRLRRSSLTEVAALAYRACLEARFVDDPHVFASVLFEGLVPLGSIAPIRRWSARSASSG